PGRSEVRDARVVALRTPLGGSPVDAVTLFLVRFPSNVIPATGLAVSCRGVAAPLGAKMLVARAGHDGVRVDRLRLAVVSGDRAGAFSAVHLLSHDRA